MGLPPDQNLSLNCPWYIFDGCALVDQYLLPSNPSVIMINQILS